MNNRIKKEALAYFFLCIAPGMHRVYLNKPGWWFPSALLIAAFTSLLKGSQAGFEVGMSAFVALIAFDVVMIQKWAKGDMK